MIVKLITFLNYRRVLPDNKSANSVNTTTLEESQDENDYAVTPCLQDS